MTSLALGIGANTAIFSFVDSILLRPLPVHDPHALVVMKWRAKGYALASSGMSWSTGGSSFDEAAGTLSSIFPYPALQVFDDARDVVTGAFGYFSATQLGVTARGETDSVKGQYVSSGYFAGVGVVPVAGRLIQAADDTAATAAVTVLSERFSRRRFGLKGDKRPAVYFSYLQSARPVGQMTYEVRTAGAPLSLAGAVRDVVRRADARLAIHDLKTQAVHIDQAISTEITLAR